MATTSVRDLVAQTFGRWTVLRRAPNSPAQKTRWLCRCACGTERVVLGNSLLNGTSVSCGCFKSDKARERTTHGQAQRGAVSPEYRTWINMIRRCTNPSSSYYHCYGARGITVCERWRHSFTAFFEDMGPRPSPKHSIERLNNDGPYEPGNCVWATAMTQGSNQRTNRLITFEGRTQTLSQWSRETGIPAPTLHRRLAEHWSVEEALMTPPVRYWSRRERRPDHR